MLLFFVTRGASSPLRDFFETWGSRLGKRIGLVYYDDLGRLDELPGAATYVFTDLERLTEAGLRATSDLADMLTRTDGAPAVLNHPRTALSRYELLRVLHERGVNPFRAHRALPMPARPRFPVFLRNEHAHDVITPLLSTEQEVERELVRAYLRGHDLASLLLIEFHDVSDERGIFHRHYGYVIGDEVIPGNLAFSMHWLVRHTGPVEGEQLAQQRAAASSREHEPFLLELAELAGVGYGRFDYAVDKGRFRIWELNTNPILVLRPEVLPPDVREERRKIAARLTAALERLAGDPWRERPPVRVSLPPTGGSLVARARRLRRRPVRVALRLAEPWLIRLLLRTRRDAILAGEESRGGAALR